MPANCPPDRRLSRMKRESPHALGVLVPLRFSPVKELPGRHPLGRAGEGMRMLRTRPYVRGEDNPRDIDKYSPPGDRQVIEWEDEAQASITLLVDVSGSMATALKAAVRDACVSQFLYSLWRAGDRVGVVLFDEVVRETIRSANLRSQMARTGLALSRIASRRGTDIGTTLNAFVHRDQRRHSHLLFVISDFLADTGTDPVSGWRSSINELQRNIVPVIISFQVPEDAEGLIRLRDPERATQRLGFFDRRRVRRINQAERRRVRTLVRRFRSAGLEALAVFSQHDAYSELARLARVRRARRS